MTDFNDPNATAARRLRLLDALHLNPDKRAEDRTIGMATGTPIGLVDDNTRQQYRVNQLDAQMQGLAVLPAAVRKSETFATLAQDDLETLASLEKVTKARQRRANAIAAAIRKANEPGLWREFGSSVWTGLRRFANNIDLQQADAARQRINDAERWTTFDITQRSLRDPDFDINAYLDEQNAYIAKEEENIRRNVAEYEEDLPALQPTRSEQSAREMQEYHNLQGPLESIAYLATHPRVAINMTGDSLGVMAPTLMATIASGGALGAPAAMTTIGVGTLQTEYSTTLAERIDAAVQQQNKSRVDILADRKLMEEIRHAASVRGSVIGATEAATLGVSGILYHSIRNKIAATAAGMGSEIIGGAGGEAMAQLAVDGRITSWSDVVAEGMLEIVLGAPEVAMHAAFARNQLQAEHNAELENQDATAAAVRDSRTRARAPDVFAQYVHDVVEDSGLGDIYADGNALHQDGLDVALAEALPERAEEIRAAVENGGAVQIPLEDYLSRIAPNEDLTNALRPHIRDADGMSAQELDNNTLGELEQDIRNEITRLAAEDTRAAEIQALEQSIIEQLNTAGQTTEEANRTYATLYTANVDVFSRQMDLSPQAYHAQYGIHIVGGQVAIRTQEGEQTLTPAEAARRLAAGAEAAVQGGQNAGTAGNTQAIDTEVVSEAARFVGMDIAGYQRAIAHDAVSIQQENGKKQNFPLTDADRTTINDTIANPDVRVYGLKTPDGQRALVSVKALPEGGVAVVEEVLAGGKTLAAKSLRRYTGDTEQTLKALREESWQRGNREAIFDVPVTPRQASAQNSYQQLDETADSAFAQAVDAVINDEYKEGKFVKLGTTPEALQLAGLPDTEISIRYSVIKKAMNNRLSLDYGHNIDAATLKAIPAQLNRPVAVMRSAKTSTNPGGYVVLTELMEEDVIDGVQKPVVVTLFLKETGHGMEVLNVSSIHGRSKGQIDKALRGDGVLYWDKEKGPQLLHSLGLYLPPRLSTDANLSRANIKTNADLSQAASTEEAATQATEAQAAQQNPAQDSYQQTSPTPRGAFHPDSNTITLTPNADLSTFIHELGHYFLETLTRHATELRARNDAGEALTDGQKQIIKDADTILANLGGLDLDTWHSMTIEEKRSHHELAARQFETYILEGKAPSLELQGAFQRFRAWLLRIYKAARNLNAPLNDEVRQVFDRLLATSDAIELAEQNRSMMQLFATPEEAGMTPEQFAEYQQLGQDATQAAQDEMQARALRDTQYIRSLQNKALKKKQQEAKAARQQAEMQARQLVLRQPVYRVWQFLSGTMNPDTTIAGNKRAWTDAVDPAHDDLNTAIAKLGGLNREAVEQEWGLDPADRIPDIRPGFPVLRRNGGLSVDGMRQALVEQGYLNDRDSLNDFYDIFSAQQRGQTQYSKLHQPDPGSGKAGEHAHLHDLPTLRLDREALLNLGYSEAQIKQLGRKVSKTGGVHPDLVAELFQDEDGNALYDSGDAMVQALLAAKRPRDAINDVADDIMLQQFGELATPQAVALAADMAVHNDIRLRMIASEANALAQAVGNKTLLNRAARQLAQETIAAKRLRDISPAQYTRMEARAAKAAALAQKKGDIATAAAEKRNQLLQAHLARAAYEAQEEAATHLRYLKRMGRLNPKHIDIKQREQIEAILERYNLRDQSRKAIDRSQTLAQWVEEQRKQGIEVNIDPKVLDEANRTPWQHLSLTDLRGLRDSIKQIEHQGRLKNELLLKRKNRELDAVITALVDGLKQHATRSGIENRTPTTSGGRALAKFRRFFFAHRKVAMIARQMDGDRDGGPVWENLIRPANERADWQTTENARATEALAHILAPLIAQKGLNQKRSYTIGGRQRSFTLQDIFVMGLNYGNDSNAQRLLGGENWSAAEFEQLLSQLNAEQLNSLQGVWDLFEQYRPQIAEVTRRVLGIEPEWITPRPFTITSADGQTVSLRGGYYPVMYDPRASARAAEQEQHDMESGAYSAAVINRGFLKSRVKEVHDRPLLYNMAGIYRGLNNVIHYLAWYEWQLDTNRLLKSKRVSDAIRDHYGADVYEQFKTWAQNVAVGDLKIEGEGVALLNTVRRNAGVAGLGFNIISALKQPLGLLQSVARVGGRHILPQLGRWMIHAPQMVREAKAQSAFMQNRARTRFRELNELAASLSQKNRLQTFLARHSYTLIMFVQMQVDTITWHAQQQKSLEAGATEAEAIQHADQAVIDSQGSGMLKDLSAAERGQVMKLFTIYYGFMNTIMNLSYNTLTSTRQGKIEKAVNLTVLLAIAPILEAALTDLLKPGDSDRWDEENMAKTMAEAMMNNLLGQFIILREMNLSGYGYTGPVGLRAIVDAYKLRDEIKQGEWDSGLRRAVIGVGGSVFGLPAAQINRTLDGLQALDDGTTDNPLAVALGKPQQ